MNHTGKHHLWLMLLGCLIPIGALGAIFLFNIPVSSVLFVGILLLCPLLHFLMMGFGGVHAWWGNVRRNFVHPKRRQFLNVNALGDIN